ncbi:MAG: bifunctional 3-phosphoshikimate 1-carboxyvinyltransferase/cytidylate kinase [Betaproteobacteria bacterium]|nr:bifunctional 3-phosphoshikimate 1-carboxyvinyltransferase/cytidylate kinase [Betaproteobacteria bacterium]
MSRGDFPEFLDLPPLSGARGTVRLPGSKSISNRTLLLAALSEGSTDIHDLLDSDDTRRMLEALVALGVKVEGDLASGRLTVHGCGGKFPQRSADLFLGNAGTAIRPLTAVLALSGGSFVLSGVARMHERPIGDLVNALRALGADIACTANEGYPPLRIGAGRISVTAPVRVRGDVSSQFLTSLLLAMPLLAQPVEMVVEGELISRPYVDITLNLMARFGVDVERTDWTRFRLSGQNRYRSPGSIHVEGDASGASYFLAAGVIGGGPVRVEGVGRASIQGDVRFADALESVGGVVTWGKNWIEASGPSEGQRPRAFDLDLNHIPDAAMTLAVLALFADGPCTLRNIASWRVKETDRLAAMANELRKVGATVEEGADQLVVTPPGRLRSGVIETYDDHRMAMCLALATLGGVPLRILDPGCVAKTFPDFFQRLSAVTQQAEVPVIAIDGPAASGKGTVARLVADALGFRYLDSGALYRAMGLAALRKGVNLDDEAAVMGVGEACSIAMEDHRLLLDGEDVTGEIRDERVSRAASAVATLPRVRALLMWHQRSFRALPGLVAEGRDMGRVVFPEAVLKVYLTASAEERARRRHKQLIEKGMHASLASLLQEIADRDSRDSTRPVAPMMQSGDSLVLDSSGLSPEEVRDRILGWFRSRTCH